MEHNGPVSATSVIETVPTHDDLAVTPTARGTGPASVVPSAPPGKVDYRYYNKSALLFFFFFQDFAIAEKT